MSVRVSVAALRKAKTAGFSKTGGSAAGDRDERKFVRALDDGAVGKEDGKEKVEDSNSSESDSNSSDNDEATPVASDASGDEGEEEGEEESSSETEPASVVDTSDLDVEAAKRELRRLKALLKTCRSPAAVGKKAAPKEKTVRFTKAESAKAESAKVKSKTEKSAGGKTGKGKAGKGKAGKGKTGKSRRVRTTEDDVDDSKEANEVVDKTAADDATGPVVTSNPGDLVGVGAGATLVVPVAVPMAVDVDAAAAAAAMPLGPHGAQGVGAAVNTANHNTAHTVDQLAALMCFLFVTLVVLVVVDWLEYWDALYSYIALRTTIVLMVLNLYYYMVGRYARFANFCDALYEWVYWFTYNLFMWLWVANVKFITVSWFLVCGVCGIGKRAISYGFGVIWSLFGSCLNGFSNCCGSCSCCLSGTVPNEPFPTGQGFTCKMCGEILYGWYCKCGRLNGQYASQLKKVEVSVKLSPPEIATHKPTLSDDTDYAKTKPALERLPSEVKPSTVVVRPVHPYSSIKEKKDELVESSPLAASSSKVPVGGSNPMVITRSAHKKSASAGEHEKTELSDSSSSKVVPGATSWYMKLHAPVNESKDASVHKGVDSSAPRPYSGGKLEEMMGRESRSMTVLKPPIRSSKDPKLPAARGPQKPTASRTRTFNQL